MKNPDNTFGHDFAIALLSVFIWSALTFMCIGAFAGEPTDKETRAANFAARRNTLMNTMPWETRSDLNYLAILADKELLVGAGSTREVDESGREFQRLLREYLRIDGEIAKAEKNNLPQSELDRIVEKSLGVFARPAKEFSARIRAHFNWVVPESRRWEFVVNDLFKPQTYHNLQLLGILADNNALPEGEAQKMDENLKRLNNLSSNMALESVTPARSEAMASAYAALLANLEKSINGLYRNLPASPRWKEWEKTE